MNKKSPPGTTLRLLQFLCKDKYLEQIEGDLFELFERDGSSRKAKRNFTWSALRFFRLRYLRELDDFKQLATLAMIKNYLKVAIRTLIKQKSYTAINITGLAIGLASCLLIVMYVTHEKSYDKFYPEVEQMYRVANGEQGSYTPSLLAETMMTDIGEVAYATRISGVYEVLIKIGDRSFIQDGASYGDQQTFNVFETEFLVGDPKTCLNEPNNVVLTESLAKKCFPNKPALNETIEIEGEVYKISGIVIDQPKNTHFPYQFVVANLEMEYTNWTGNNYWTYAKTRPKVSEKNVNEKLKALYKKYVGPPMLTYTGHESFEELESDYPDRLFGFTIYPVEDIHLHRPRFSMGAKGDAKNILIFSLIGIFILLIACVNYINMSTARSAVRSKEVGIRKTLGSQKGSIVRQFLVESQLITVIAVVLAIAMAFLSLNYFNQLTGRNFTYQDLFTWTNMSSIVILLLLVGLLAGGYPAYVISNFSPLKALKGQLNQGGKKGLRSVLVAFQFAISVFLVAATVVIYQQLQHMQSKELGINIEQTLVINNGIELGEKYEVFKAQLEQMAEVEIVGKASNIPFHGYGDWGYTLPEDNNRAIGPYNAFMSPETQDVLEIEMVAGRYFSENMVSDTASVVINEALAKEIGAENLIGQRLSRGGGDLSFTVIGVMKDFNFTTLKRDIAPVIFRYGTSSQEIGEYHQSFIVAKVASSDLSRTLRSIEEKWNVLVPNYPFDSTFMDDSFQKQYEGERKFGQVFTTFSLLAIFIAFLGLFALTTFVLQARFKEIAVRKVLGASVASLLRMVLKDFTILVVIGGIVGIGSAFFWLENWLQDYSYRISLSWYLMLIPIVLILLLTWVVVSLKSYKAATSNPAMALKDE